MVIDFNLPTAPQKSQAKQYSCPPTPIIPISKDTLSRGRNSSSLLRWLNTHTLLSQDINQKRANLFLNNGTNDLLSVLVTADVLKVHVEEVATVHWSSLCLGVELGAEDGAAGVDHTLVGAIVQVDEVLLEVVWQGGGVDCVSVVLGCDMALSRGAVEGGDVVRAVTVFELDGASAGGESEKLMAETDAEDWDLGGLHQALEVVDGVCAVGWVTGAVGDEDAVEVVGDFVDGEVEGEDGDGGAAGDERAEDVLLNSAVDDGYVHVALGGGDVEGRLGGDALDEVDLLGIHKGFVLVGVVFLADGDTGEG